jgi:hypothetical protein
MTALNLSVGVRNLRAGAYSWWNNRSISTVIFLARVFLKENRERGGKTLEITMKISGLRMERLQLKLRQIGKEANWTVKGKALSVHGPVPVKVQKSVWNSSSRARALLRTYDRWHSTQAATTKLDHKQLAWKWRANGRPTVNSSDGHSLCSWLEELICHDLNHRSIPFPGPWRNLWSVWAQSLWPTDVRPLTNRRGTARGVDWALGRPAADSANFASGSRLFRHVCPSTPRVIQIDELFAADRSRTRTSRQQRAATVRK